MSKLSVCILFGGMSPEHDVSLRSAESVLNNMDPEKYNIFPVGITKEGNWVLYNSTDYSKLPTGEWLENPDNRRAAISPVRGQGLLSFEGDCVVRERIDVVFPVLHGTNGEDGAIQGLLQIAGIPIIISTASPSHRLPFTMKLINRPDNVIPIRVNNTVFKVLIPVYIFTNSFKSQNYLISG